MNRTAVATEPLIRVSQEALDLKISQVATELFGDASPADPSGADWVPVPISAAELVRRMQPFVVYN